MEPKFKRGDTVRKIKGSEWVGKVVGEYSTYMTPEGYAVESSAHRGCADLSGKCVGVVKGLTPPIMKEHKQECCEECGCPFTNAEGVTYTGCAKPWLFFFA